MSGYHKIMSIQCILLLCLISRLTKAAVVENQNIVSVNTVCFGEMGCLDFKPKPHVKPNDKLQEFVLYTRKHFIKGQILKVNSSETIKNSNFNPKNPTKFLIHGWRSESDSRRRWMLTMKNQLLINSDSNVILVQWLSDIDYLLAIERLKRVGWETGNLINYLRGLVGLDPQNVHLIGHSLGAHAAGYAGKHLQGLVGRITGLDPAGPGFEEMTSKHRLYHTDAQLVDVIHTDAHILGFGITIPCGHVDFYPNGGTKQPGCIQFNDGIRRQENEFLCDHKRAQYLFIESINSKCSFVANKCDSYKKFLQGTCDSNNVTDITIMGLKTRKPSYPPGTKYFLTTADASPYCRQKYKVPLNLTKPLEFGQKNSGLLNISDSPPNGVPAF
ncbi:pancreatic triacylglycerol lipase-like isoform X2 [Adelges cooleyi]|uniref:pancreatic triacylglycerol lipase-like isoform X2 n=2 Tax=Adelges cooleyi TaxID=133065 RepID=UPI00217FE180|nr:pancreatic triacylglycerol lipase-like isoform X2 [Adelges cooleyi]XP_050442366.1 pancreatic triacylglycerol lipase-like isoform X2 [Adelges cooleyi]XP_050442367.1 pancreatic triacylglycerol lipase-like isoform X2 [Adelges cooleyi]